MACLSFIFDCSSLVSVGKIGISYFRPMSFLKKAWEKSFSEPNYRLALHIIFWLLYFFAFSYWDYYVLTETGWKDKDILTVWYITMVLNILVIIFSYYLTIRTTYRNLIQKKKYLWFFITLILNLVVFSFLLIGARAFGNKVMIFLGIIDFPKSMISSMKEVACDHLTIASFMQMTQSYFALLCLPVLGKFFRDQLRLGKRRLILEKENLHLQMNLLKSQIHPHFLFNTLNNIYSFIAINLSIAPDYIELRVENSFDKSYRKENQSGIGLANLKKTLAYYYPDGFIFETKEESGRYSVISH